MKEIKNQTFGEERALYHTENALVEDCRFEGEADGESFLKESANITVRRCFMDLRYPMWHCENIRIENCEMSERCRAALWYDRCVTLSDCKMNGIKALRECKDVRLEGVEANSPEFGWRCDSIKVEGGKIIAEYAFFESKNIRAENLELTGKYAFQYTENVFLKNAKCKTKDAFWHTKNARAEDCDLDGEYIGWYSDGLTLVNCRIRGSQPFCYCKNLRLIDCTMEDCDLAFEYSDVFAEIRGEILSVKNPLSGKIVADRIGEIILRDSKYSCHAEIALSKS